MDKERVGGYSNKHGRTILCQLPARGAGRCRRAGSPPSCHGLPTRPGDAVCLFNGDGPEYPAVVVECQQETGRPGSYDRRLPVAGAAVSLEVAAPLPKGDRALPGREADRTRRHPVRPACGRGAAWCIQARRELEKLERAVIEASKQCGRNRLMEIGPLTAVGRLRRRAELPTQTMAGPPDRRR